MCTGMNICMFLVRENLDVDQSAQAENGKNVDSRSKYEQARSRGGIKRY